MRFMAMKVGDVLFLDTNVLLIATDRSRAGHTVAQKILIAGSSGTIHLAFSGQIIREYLVVATRPLDVNGLAMSTADALRNVAAFRRRTLFFDETEAVSNQLDDLVKLGNIAGKRIHDANVAATMIVHKIPILISENGDDFSPFPDVSVLRIHDAFQSIAALGLK